MTLLGDVEFFADDGSVVGSDEEAVEVGTRPVPRWALVMIGTLVATAVVGILATRPQPKAATADPKPSVPRVVTTPHPEAIEQVGQVGQAVQVDGAVVSDARDAVVHRGRLYIMRFAAVAAVDLATNRVESVSLSGPFALAAGSSARLLLDPDADRLWVLAMGARPAELLEISASRMLPIRRLSLPLGVHDAAAMDGHVYLATSTGLADLPPGAAHAVTLRGGGGSVSAVAADPVRHRVLALDISPPYADIMVSAGGKVSRRSLGGNLIKASITVAGDAIWVGGYGGDPRSGYHAIVAALDPITLTPVATSAVALKVERVIVSRGTHDIWIGTDGPGLWCIDPYSGDVLQHWPYATAPVTSQVGRGPVQSRAASAYAVYAGRLVSLVLSGCAG
ncbi:MAG: hypothetical protein ABI808_01885 [Pseudonocardiales bacterium]